MQFDPVFSAITQKLLKGEMICQASNEEFFFYLEDKGKAEKVNDYLYQIDRVLTSTRDGAVYFAAFASPNERDARAAIRSQFRLVATDLEAMVKWMRLVMAVNANGNPLSAGDMLKEGDMLTMITDMPENLKALEDLATTSYIGSKANSASAWLKQIIKRLCDDGYLVSAGGSGTRYLATGKWSWLYEVMEFIRDHEQLSDDEDGIEQAEIF